jgi:hypothetical protein
MRGLRFISFMLSTILMLLAAPVAHAMLARGNTYFTGKVLVGSSYVHGPNMSLTIWPGRKAILVSDCTGSVAAFGRWPKYNLRIFKPDRLVTTTCLAPNDFSDPQKYPNDPAYHRLARQRMWQAARRSCNLLRKTVRNGQPRNRRASIPCGRIRKVAGNGRETTIHYSCPRGRPHAPRIVNLKERLLFPSPGLKPDGFLHLGHFRRTNCNRQARERKDIGGIWMNLKRPYRRKHGH